MRRFCITLQCVQPDQDSNARHRWLPLALAFLLTLGGCASNVQEVTNVEPLEEPVVANPKPQSAGTLWNGDEGNWLADLGDSIENSPAKLSVRVPVGSFLLINNLFWLHGRDRFIAHPGLRRELMRQRGYFTHKKVLRQPRQ